MTTVAKLIEWLQTLPQDAIVECGKEVSRSYETHMVMDTVNIGSCWIRNSEGEEHKDSPYYGKLIVNP